MIRTSAAFVFVTASLLALLWTGAARAQVPEPTPTPDPMVYSDPGMNFTAPPGAVLVGRQNAPEPKNLSSDLQIVARWALHSGKEDVRFIDLAMESFEANPYEWEPQFESQAHQNDGVLVRNKTPMSLLNGMPATFVEVTFGTGFDARKEYAIVWADGVRGVVLSVTARIGEVSPEEAKQLLRNATATRYPMEQP